MGDWVHCNLCFNKPGPKSGKFYLASCGEIFCQKCISESGNNSTCKICKQPLQVLEINRQLKPELQLLFLEQKEVIKRQSKELFKIMEFQAKHRNQDIKMQQEKFKKVEKFMEYFKAEMEKKAALEKNFTTLKDGYKRLHEEHKKIQKQHNSLAEKHKNLIIEEEQRRKKAKLAMDFTDIGRADENFTSGALFQNFDELEQNLQTPVANPASTSTPRSQVLSAGRIATALKAGLRNSGSGGHRRTPTRNSPALSITTPLMLGLGASGKSANPYDGVWQQAGNSPITISPRTISRSKSPDTQMLPHVNTVSVLG